jgi:hypothetical protein
MARRLLLRSKPKTTRCVVLSVLPYPHGRAHARTHAHARRCTHAAVWFCLSPVFFFLTCRLTPLRLTHRWLPRYAVNWKSDFVGGRCGSDCLAPNKHRSARRGRSTCTRSTSVFARWRWARTCLCDCEAIRSLCSAATYARCCVKGCLFSARSNHVQTRRSVPFFFFGEFVLVPSLRIAFVCCLPPSRVTSPKKEILCILRTRSAVVAGFDHSYMCFFVLHSRAHRGHHASQAPKSIQSA